jgi:hypothetical protein
MLTNAAIERILTQHQSDLETLADAVARLIVTSGQAQPSADTECPGQLVLFVIGPDDEAGPQ